MKSEGSPPAASDNAAADPAMPSETPPTPSAGAGRRRAGCRVGFSPPFPPIPPIRPKPPPPPFLPLFVIPAKAGIQLPQRGRNLSEKPKPNGPDSRLRGKDGELREWRKAAGTAKRRASDGIGCFGGASDGIVRPLQSTKPARRGRHRQQKTARPKPRGQRKEKNQTCATS